MAASVLVHVGMCFLFVGVLSFVFWGRVARDSISHSSYRGLVTNKSLVFSSKKVEFPGSPV